MMKTIHKKTTLILVGAILISMICGKACFAQNARTIEKISQNYVVFGNDIASYEIIYDPSNDKCYLNYSELIREKIKQRLKKIFRCL